MSNENFVPTYSTDMIYYSSDMDRCLTDDLDTLANNISALDSTVAGKAPAVHSHPGYAAVNHTHNQYVTIDHDHDYASADHIHIEYALTEHTHNTYAPASHNHSGYASTTDLLRLQTLVGDTSVSSQIATAIADKADLSHTHSNATSSSAGFMSATDKSIIDTIVVRDLQSNLDTATFTGRCLQIMGFSIISVRIVASEDIPQWTNLFSIPYFGNMRRDDQRGFYDVGHNVKIQVRNSGTGTSIWAQSNTAIPAGAYTFNIIVM